MCASLVECRERAVGCFVPFQGVALGDVLEVVVGQVLGGLPLLAGGYCPRQVRPFLDGEHPVLPCAEKVQGGLQHGLELGLAPRTR